MLRSLLFRSLFVASIVSVAASAQEEKREVALPLGGGVELKIVRIEPGSFRQGSPVNEAGRGADETEREVTITRGFYLGKFPVTRGQFALFVAQMNYRTEAETGTSGGFGWDGAKLTQRKDFTWRNPGFAQTDDDPVVIVTFGDAQKFLGWLSRKSGAAFELPSEAQWEYACRAGVAAAFPNGEDGAWHKANAGNGTKPVGQKPLNAWGLGDMNGNVWEWCADWFAPYAPGPQSDPVQRASNLSDKPRRVLRGGSWLREAKDCRSAARYRNDPQSRNADNGFRVMAFQLAAPRAAIPQPPATAPSVPLERTTAEPDRIIVPHNDASAPPLPRGTAVTRVSWGFGSLGCVCFGTVVIIVVVVSLFRRIIRGGGSSAAGSVIPNLSMPGLATGGGGSLSGPLRTRVVDDGFWIEGELPHGTLVACRYVVNGQQQESEVAADGTPGGQFVYTGARPANVSIVVAPGGGPTRTQRSGFPPAAPLTDDFDDDARRSSRPPSAY